MNMNQLHDLFHEEVSPSHARRVEMAVAPLLKEAQHEHRTSSWRGWLTGGLGFALTAGLLVWLRPFSQQEESPFTDLSFFNPDDDEEILTAAMDDEIPDLDLLDELETLEALNESDV